MDATEARSKSQMKRLAIQRIAQAQSEEQARAADQAADGLVSECLLSIRKSVADSVERGQEIANWSKSVEACGNRVNLYRLGEKLKQALAEDQFQVSMSVREEMVDHGDSAAPCVRHYLVLRLSISW